MELERQFIATLNSEIVEMFTREMNGQENQLQSESDTNRNQIDSQRNLIFGNQQNEPDHRDDDVNRIGDFDHDGDIVEIREEIANENEEVVED